MYDGGLFWNGDNSLFFYFFVVDAKFGRGVSVCCGCCCGDGLRLGLIDGWRFVEGEFLNRVQ